MGEDVNTYFWCRSLKEGDFVEDIDVDGKIILEWIFKK
jgi:hypothetical protein